MSKIPSAEKGAQLKVSYHHGELPQTLMNLALHAIACHGTEKLSLRALAREAGVSPTAPYRHFESKQGLLAAIATQGFERLQQINRAASAPGSTLEERLLAMATSYVEFACDNPVSYQLMFGSVLGDFSDYTMLQQVAARSYDDVYVLLEDAITQRGLDVDLDQLGGVIWSTVHGMASLLISNVSVGAENSAPMRALASLNVNPRGALEVAFADLLVPVG